MKIPWTMISDRALRGVIEDFVLREGTDYGEKEYSLDTKVAQVKQQLERGEAVLFFDEKTGTCTLRRADESVE